MAFTMKASGVPVGSYRAKFKRWEQSTHAEYGDRVQFVWEIIDGEHKGAEASRFTGAKLSPKAALAKILGGLTGRKIGIGDEVNPDDYIGKEFLLIVAETESGASRVETVLPAAEAK